jgi:predicted MFS family arabinose efflux permease
VYDRPVRALAESRFRLLFLGQTASGLGSSLVPVALAFAALDVSGSATGLGLVLAASRVPQVVFTLAGGVAGDRLPRRLVMLASDLVRLGTQGGTAVLLLTGHARLWELAALQAVHGTAAAFFNPAATGLVPQTVPPGLLQQANALLGMSRSGAAIAAQPIAGILVVAAGPGTAFAVDAGSYAVSAAALGLLRVDGRLAAPARSLLGDAVAGWREFRARRWLWSGSTQIALVNAVSLAPFFVLGPLVAERSLGGPGAWAAVATGFAAGMLAGGALALRLRPRSPLVVAFSALFLAAPQLVLMAVAAPVPLVAAAAFAGGLQATLWTALWSTTLQSSVPPESVSRVDATSSVATLVLAPLGFALAGPAAAAFGVAAVLGFGAAWIVATTAAVLLLGDLRSPVSQPIA